MGNFTTRHFGGRLCHNAAGIAALAAIAGLSLANTSRAAQDNYIGPASGSSAYWSIAANWSAGVPASGSYVSIGGPYPFNHLSSGGTISYDVPSGSNPQLQELFIGMSNSGSIQLQFPNPNGSGGYGSYLSATTEVLAGGPTTSDAALIYQLGGVNTTSNLYVGSVSSDGRTGYCGEYILLNGSTLNGGTEYVGAANATGFMSQSNYSVNKATSINIGSAANSIGQYIISNFAYNVTLTTTADITVGDSGTGTFTQGGNAVTIGTYLSLGGSSSSAVGTYNLESGSLAGTLNAQNEYIGNSGSGTFNQSGSTNTVASQLTIAVNYGSLGTYTLSGGTLQLGQDVYSSLFHKSFFYAGSILNNGTFNQSGGMIQDIHSGLATTFTNSATGTFNASGGVFNASLINNGTVNIIPGAATQFVVGGSITNNSVIQAADQTLTINGGGLNNLGQITLRGTTLNGTGPLTNNSQIAGWGNIGGTGGFTNNGLLTQTVGSGTYAPSGNLTLSNTGGISNTGTILMATGYVLTLSGSPLTNTGTVNLNGGTVTGSATLINAAGGVVQGSGLVIDLFANNAGATLLLQAGTTHISTGFTNAGTVLLDGVTANLTGGGITNNGTIQGFGNIGSGIVNGVGGTVEALGGTLILSGTLGNAGLISAPSGAKVLLVDSPGVNRGTISLTGGIFDTNGNILQNTGEVSGYGTFSTGGFENGYQSSPGVYTPGSATFTGGTTTVNGAVTNDSGSTMTVEYNPAIFTGNVTNNGTVFITQTTASFAGTYTDNGTTIHDPSTTIYNNWTVGTSGSTTAGASDLIEVTGNFINNSTKNTSWNTVLAELRFLGGTAHTMDVAGTDMGATTTGFNNNFAWGILQLYGTGDSLILGKGTGLAADVNGAFYTEELLLAGGTSQIADITGNGVNIYYDPTNIANAYLGGKTYALTNGGKIAPVPEPGALALLTLAGAGMLLLKRRKKSAVPQ